MDLTYVDVINNELVSHAKLTTSDSEKVTYYIDRTIGWNVIDKYVKLANSSYVKQKSIDIYNVGHTDLYESFIREAFKEIDKIIDLDFMEMKTNNGSMIDIYKINYSSEFTINTIGQAMAQEIKEGAWWDIFWKDSFLVSNTKELDSNQNTILHEIGHTLGLGHPRNNPTNQSWTSKDTIMSYNKGPEGWDKWFSHTDINALISIWGREDDLGFINYSGNSIEYKYKKDLNNKYFIKTDIGYEDITEISSLKFTDKTVDVNTDIKEVFKLIKDINSVNSKVYRLYNSAFRRFPDPDGLKYWIEKNMKGIDSYRSTAKSFIASEEFTTLYGEDSSNDIFIKSLYNNVLNRLPDQEGYNYWINQLDEGYEDRSELLIGFSESLENKAIFSSETMIF